MTSKSMVAAFISLSAVSQMAYCAEPEQTRALLKDHYRHPALAHASVQQHTVASLPGRNEKQAFFEPRMESPESGSIPPATAVEVKNRDDNEQFTRMSCCP